MQLTPKSVEDIAAGCVKSNNLKRCTFAGRVFAGLVQRRVCKFADLLLVDEN